MVQCTKKLDACAKNAYIKFEINAKRMFLMIFVLLHSRNNLEALR